MPARPLDQKVKVLYIEDNRENRMLVRAVLEAAGYLIVEAEDGLAGIEAAIREEPALILLDINLPGVDGYEIVAILKSFPNLASTPVIAVTAYAMQGDRQRTLVAGCDGYLQKPINVDAFPRQVAEFLGGKRERVEGREEGVYLRELNQRLVYRLLNQVEELKRLNQHFVRRASQLEDLHRAMQDITSELGVAGMLEKLLGGLSQAIGTTSLSVELSEPPGGRTGKPRRVRAPARRHAPGLRGATSAQRARAAPVWRRRGADPHQRGRARYLPSARPGRADPDGERHGAARRGRRRGAHRVDRQAPRAAGLQRRPDRVRRQAPGLARGRRIRGGSRAAALPRERARRGLDHPLPRASRVHARGAGPGRGARDLGVGGDPERAPVRADAGPPASHGDPPCREPGRQLDARADRDLEKDDTGDGARARRRHRGGLAPERGREPLRADRRLSRAQGTAGDARERDPEVAGSPGERLAAGRGTGVRQSQPGGSALHSSNRQAAAAQGGPHPADALEGREHRGLCDRLAQGAPSLQLRRATAGGGHRAAGRGGERELAVVRGREAPDGRAQADAGAADPIHQACRDRRAGGQHRPRDQQSADERARLRLVPRRAGPPG